MKRAFTLIELLVVIAIIGILISVVVSAYKVKCGKNPDCGQDKKEQLNRW